MPLSEIQKLAIALARGIESRLEDIASQDFPTDTPESFARLLRRVIVSIRESVPGFDDQTCQWACQILCMLGSHLRYLDGASSSKVPASIIAPLTSLIRKLAPDADILLRVQWTYNYTVFELLESYTSMLSQLLPQATIDQCLDGMKRLYVIGVPSIEHSNVLLHSIIGHEFGHRLASEYLASEDQSALMQSITTACGDFKWHPSITNLPPLFHLPMRQEIVASILVARSRALEELVSDMVGMILFGVSSLFSLADLSSMETLDTPPSPRHRYYPPWRYRIREMMRYSDTTDLESQLLAIGTAQPARHVADVSLAKLATLRSIASADADIHALNSDGILKRAYQDIPSALLAAQAFVEARLGGMTFPTSDVAAQCNELLHRLALGILPNECSASDCDFRMALAAGWLYRASRLPVPFEFREWAPEDDETLSRLVLKATEAIQLRTDFHVWQAGSTTP